MLYQREWRFLGTGFDGFHAEPIEQIEDWGKSYFWYCRICRFEYASIKLIPEDGSHRIWQGVSGVCCECQGNRWTIPGSLEEAFIDGAPREAYIYQLSREIAFLSDLDHPHNKEPAP